MTKRSKRFIVASVSDNTNSFGLQGMILVAQDGEAFEVGANYINVKSKGEVLRLPLDNNGKPDFSNLGFEIPRQLPNAPPGVVTEVWSLPVSGGSNG